MHKVMTPERVRELLQDGGKSLFEAGASKAPKLPTGGQVPEWFTGKAHAYSVNVVAEITPQLATDLLERNERNRKPSQPKIKRYAAMLLDDQWDLNGETLKFSESGRLLDGQSRLQAVILSGRSALMEVRFGLPEKTQQTMDTGEQRRLQHELEMRGEKDCTNLAAVIRGIHLWLNNAYTARAAEGKTVERSRAYYLTTRQGIELLDKFPRIRESLKACRRPACEAVLSPGKLAVLHFLMRHSQQRAYMWAVLNGDGGCPDCPVLWVRNRVIAGKLEDDKIPVRQVIGMVIKAHNKLIRGESGPCPMRRDEPLPEILRTKTLPLKPEDVQP